MSVQVRHQRARVRWLEWAGGSYHYRTHETIRPALRHARALYRAGKAVDVCPIDDLGNPTGFFASWGDYVEADDAEAVDDGE